MKLDEIQGCYSASTDMFKYVDAFLDDLEHLHFIKAFVQLQKFIYHLKLDLV